MTDRPCIRCGDPIPTGSHCPACAPPDHPQTAHQRGYDAAWNRLSRKARRLQPWCTDCGTTRDLQTDHTPEAWRRHNAGLPVRLADVEVVCGPCNRSRGAARQGGRPQNRSSGPLVKAQRPLHTGGDVA